MRTNGTLRYLIGNAIEHFDEDGEPIKIFEDKWSHAIPCFIRIVTNSSQGRYEDGIFNQYSYEVLIEGLRLSKPLQRIKLVLNGEDIGEYEVQGRPERTSVNRIKIVV